MISNRTHYALKAMLELSLRYRQGPVAIGQIAESQKIPARFLEAILRQLKQAGFATSARGKEGGYFLARQPHEISMGDVIRVFEGPFLHIDENADDVPDVFTPVWKKAGQSLAAVFDQTNFATLADNEQNRVYVIATNYAI
jgi:Rrf2 family cysteine metabolism transcriptional repressor